MTVVVGLARLLLAAVFGLSGAAKLADLRGTAKSIADFGAPKLISRPGALILSMFEIVCAIALVGSAAWWGAIGILAMLAVFIAAVLVNIARGRRPECHCFGQLHAEPIGWRIVLRDLLLSAVAGWIVFGGPVRAETSILGFVVSLPGLQLAVLGLAAMSALQLWFALHLLRQNGRLILRIDALEAKSGVAAAPRPQGLAVNTTAPEFSLSALDGRIVDLESLSQAGQPLLLIFSDSGCSACEALLPEIVKWQSEFRDRIWIGLITRGTDAVRAKLAPAGIENVLLQEEWEVASAYKVEQTPSAVIVMAGQISSALATGADEIRTLVSRASLPRPVSKGDLVPPLRLADLKGESLDLSTLKGQKRLLLFWNPACGFCQQMLADVKTWEHNPPPGAPELLVVSSGSFESNREQGLRSRVLLDPNFGAGYVFQAGGTPSAVIIGEDGKIASEVKVGAQDVLALAGASANRVARR